MESSEKMAVINIKSNKKEVCKICQQILSCLKENNYSDDDIFGIHLSLEEAIVNAVEHGNNNDPDKTVTIEYCVDSEKMEITICDQGPGFIPKDVPDPRNRDNICKPGGRGVLLMNAYMDIVEYNKKGNCVHMVKYHHLPAKVNHGA